ncbi:MAG TPA: hypothetical protein VFC78_18440 [Tepidisphaeraceae bacterium]|nr:hypothetical protein [Tepidisphaeraceae bacterium]
MGRILIIVFATACAVTLMVVAFWAWQGSADWASDWQLERPQAAAWAVRSAAIAAAALAQFLIVRCVVGSAYRRRFLDDVLCLGSAVASAIALVSAAALALAGR